MVRVIYVQPDGETQATDAVRGENVMSTALANAVPGIVGDCRGGLSCATCHVFVDDSWIARTGRSEGDESEMLETTAEPATDHSRLGCQIVLDENFDGLIVHVPEAQE